MVNSALEKSEKLSNSPMQRLSSKVHKFCTKCHLPRVHGCLWDRHCRWCDAPRRIQLFWGRHDMWVDLPGHDKATTMYRIRDGRRGEPIHIPASWQFLPQFGYWRHDKKEADD